VNARIVARMSDRDMRGRDCAGSFAGSRCIGKRAAPERRLSPAADEPPSKPRGGDLSRCSNVRQQSCGSLDRLVGAAEQRDRKSDAKGLGAFEVDDQFNFTCLLNRQIGRFLALQNPASIDTGHAV
jgi:hypothetical protein